MEKIMKLALQLYTLRDTYLNKEEFKAVLRKVKELGYDGVAWFCTRLECPIGINLQFTALFNFKYRNRSIG